VARARVRSVDLMSTDFATTTSARQHADIPA